MEQEIKVKIDESALKQREEVGMIVKNNQREKESKMIELERLVEDLRGS